MHYVIQLDFLERGGNGCWEIANSKESSGEKEIIVCYAHNFTACFGDRRGAVVDKYSRIGIPASRGTLTRK